MQFSIIIPTYNYGHFIAAAIQSVLAQPNKNYELIIVDDGSTDNTKAIVSKFVKQNSFVRYIKQSNQGAAAARNLGIKLASGDYLLFLDADDRLSPTALSHFQNTLISTPNLDMICGGYTSAKTSGKIKSHPLMQTLSANSTENFINYLRGKFVLVNGATLFHKRIFTKIHYPSHLRKCEDISVFAHTLALFNCTTISEPVVKIYQHTDSLRHQVGYDKSIGTGLVDLIFDSNILPESFFRYRQEYYAIRCLELFRTLYYGKDYRAAKHYYWQAIKNHPLYLLKLSALKKYLRIVFRN